MKYTCLLFLFLFLFRTHSFNQAVQEEALHLDLHNPGRYIENIICMDLSEMRYRSLHATTGKKLDIKTRRVIINGDTLLPERIHTRGQTTLNFRRKSLNFKLSSTASFNHGAKKESFNRFLLLNLSMDKFYCRNRLAFEMMDTLELFKLFYSFCELKINDRSEGVFMILERPEDWAFKKKGSPLIIRRGIDQLIEEVKSDERADKAEIKQYVGNYKQIYRSLTKFKGEALYEELLEYIDIDFYMKWLAFNFLIHNGDYSDEVFFYIDPEINKYRIIPWDYDDIFATTPHEGTQQRNKAIGDKLLFSSEDILDKTIANDPYLYEAYKKILKEVLETLSPGLLKQIIERTYAELYPFYSDEEIISNVQFDNYTHASLENLRLYLSQIYLLLYNYRNSYLQFLEPGINTD